MPPLKRQAIRLEDLLGPQGLQMVIVSICQHVDEARERGEAGSTLARRVAEYFIGWSRATFGPVPPVRTLRRINNLVKTQIIADYTTSAYSRVLGPDGPGATFDDLVQHAALQHRQEAAIRVLEKDDSSNSWQGILSSSKSNIDAEDTAPQGAPQDVQ